MKRALIYHSIYESDGANFSTCSTKYELLNGLHDDSAGIDELRKIAKKLKLKVNGVAEVKSGSDIQITEALRLVGKQSREYFGKIEKNTRYIGFVKIPEVDFEATAKVDSKMPKKLALEIEGDSYNGRLGFSGLGTMNDGTVISIMASWVYYHAIPILGYTLDSFHKALGVDDTAFDDSVQTCSECGVLDYQDDGYTYNHRYVESAGSLGIECGCYAAHCERNVGEFANSPTQAIELETAKKLQKDGKLKFLERFIGGMTDGRGGYYDGKSTREGDPKEVLKDLLKKKPKGKFVFTHDESGQFQTYFSVWELRN